MKHGIIKKMLNSAGDWFNHFFGVNDGDQTHYVTMAQTRTQRQDGGSVARVDRLRALWDGSDSGINLASPMAYVPVSAVRSLVGCPMLISKDDRTQDKLNEIRRQYLVDESPLLTQTTLITGTGWRFPQWDLIEDRYYIEAIADDEVVNYRQAQNGAIVEMWLDKQVNNLQKGKHLPFPTTYRIRRHITRDYIEIEYTGGISSKERRLNYFHTFPVPFGHDCYENEWRGNSIYGRSWRTLKFYHDVQYKAGEILAKFNPKLVQTLIDNGVDPAGDWLKNQSGTRNGGIDVLDDELIINRTSPDKGADSSQFIFMPSDSINAYNTIMDRLQKQAQWGSGLPEIFYPSALTSNQASAAYQTQQGIAAIVSIQREQTAPYKRLITQLLNLIGYVEGYQYDTGFEVKWNEFTMLTPEEKASTFTSFASGLATLIGANTMTEDMALDFIKYFYPQSSVKTVDDLKNGILNWHADITEPVTQAAESTVTPEDLEGVMGF